MSDITTKKQIVEGTIKGMAEIGEYSQELINYVRRRLERAYDKGYENGVAETEEEIVEI